MKKAIIIILGIAILLSINVFVIHGTSNDNKERGCYIINTDLNGQEYKWLVDCDYVPPSYEPFDPLIWPYDKKVS